MAFAVAAAMAVVLGPASVASDGGGANGKTKAPAAYSGWEVTHFGYTPGEGTWQSAAMDASIPQNRDASRFVPHKATATKIANATTAAAATGFVCSLAVSNVSLSAGRLQGSTLQTCTGAFKNQHHTQWFMRDSWLGWKVYYGPMFTTTTNATQASWSWSVNCGFGGDPGGTYNYRQQARAYATSTETGVEVAGQIVYSGSTSRYVCGTGNS